MVFFYRMKIYHATYIMKSRLILSFRNLKNHRHEFFLIFLNLKKSKKVKWIRISDPWSVFLMDLDMDRPVKNPVPIRSESESDKINGYGYGFRLIRSKPDPLTGLIRTISNTWHVILKSWISTKIHIYFHKNYHDVNNLNHIIISVCNSVSK